MQFLFSSVLRSELTARPNQSSERTADGVGSPAIAVRVASRRWFNGRQAAQRAMTRKRKLTAAIGTLGIVSVLMLGGCFRLRTGAGSIYYEAKSAEAVQALNSRIEPLRTALRSDDRFIEEAGKRTLSFVGAKNGEFVDCWIGFNRDERDGDKNRRAVLVVSTGRTFSFSTRVRRLRKVVEQSLSPDVVKLLKISFDENLMDVR
jgi:hypothetical protein